MATSENSFLTAQVNLKDTASKVLETVLNWQQTRLTLPPAGTALSFESGGLAPDWTNELVAQLPSTGYGIQALPLIIEEILKIAGNEAQQPGHPGYLAYVSGAGDVVSALGSFISKMTNPYTGTFSTAPSWVALEQQAVRWLAQMIGYSDACEGFLTSGGSISMLSA